MRRILEGQCAPNLPDHPFSDGKESVGGIGDLPLGPSPTTFFSGTRFAKFQLGLASNRAVKQKLNLLIQRPMLAFREIGKLCFEPGRYAY